MKERRERGRERNETIKDIPLLLTEFKAHNDELVDYIIELEAEFKEILGE